MNTVPLWYIEKTGRGFGCETPESKLSVFVLSVLHEGDLPLLLCFVTNLVSFQFLSIVVFGWFVFGCLT